MKYLVFFSLLFSSLVSFSQNRILVDGLFDEWDAYPIAYDDASGDGGFLGIDFLQLKMANDEEFLFLSLEVGIEINLQDLNDLTLYLDTDEDASTGFSVNDIGAELVYNFGNRAGVFYASGGSVSVSHIDIGLVSTPTVTSDRFEIAIRKDISVSGVPLFQDDQLKVVLKNNTSTGDVVPATDEELTYTFATDSSGPLPNYSIQKQQVSDLRIISYNVLSDGLFVQSRVPSFTRILQATQPDIIGFQEIYDYSSAQVANQIEAMLPSAAGQQWYHAKQGPDCHAISKYPILQSALIPGYNSNAGNGAFLIDLPGMEPDLLLIVAHLPCCTNDSGRQTEVDLIMAFLREAKAGNGPIPLAAGSPIVILGDMNLVGNNRQVETLLSGDIAGESTYGPDFAPDWNGNDLLDSHPYATAVPFSYTWYRGASSFSPGRLDYIIYSGSNLLLQNSYSLFTSALPPDSLSAFNLFANDVLVASDHLPVVTDFAVSNLTAQAELPAEQQLGILGIYPNPSRGFTELSFSIQQREFVTLQLMSQNGKEMNVLRQETFPAGEHTLQLDTSKFPAGMYYLHIKTATFMDTRKVIVGG